MTIEEGPVKSSTKRFSNHLPANLGKLFPVSDYNVSKTLN